jgi:hypothetical protein
MGSSSKMAVLRTALLFVLILGMISCGVKRPPRPLGMPAPPTVTDLSHTILDGAVELKWHVPKGSARVMNLAQGFIVYRYQAPLTEEKCSGCPMLFKRVADIPLSVQGEDGELTFSEPISSGYRYTYKVALSLQNGIIGGDSNLVEFEAK